MVQINTWVQIHKIILNSEERAPQVPDDTKKVPLEMWVKGFLIETSEIGDIVKVKTITGRIEEGELIQVNPTFKHNYGNFVPEILQIGQIVKDFIYGDEV